MTDVIIRNIRQILQLEGISNRELANGINISLSSLEHMLYGSNSFNTDLLRPIAEFLNVSLLELEFGLSPERASELSKIPNKKFLDVLLIDCNLENYDVSYDELLNNIHNCGKNLKLICEIKKITLTSLAKSLNISSRTLIRHTNETNLFKPETLIMIAKFLNISVIDLILGSYGNDIARIAERILKIVPVGKNIIEICITKNVDYYELVKVCNVNHNVLISNEISIHDLENIAKVLHVSIEAILLRNVDISRNIKLFCFLQGMTIQELEVASKVSIHSLRSNSYTISSLQKIAEVLDVSVEQIVIGFSKYNETLITDTKSIGRHLQIILETKKISYRELAYMTGLDISTISNIKNGYCCSAHSIKTISEALAISIAGIIFGTFLEEFKNELSA